MEWHFWRFNLRWSKNYCEKGTSGNTGGSSNGGSNNNQSGTNTYYTIKSGDTLNKISAQFGVSVANLQAWNNISGSLIFAGQKIIVKKAPTQVQRIRTSLRIMVAVRQHPTRLNQVIR